MLVMNRSFYEFFAGGGMARIGLGVDWTCLLGNDNDPVKGMSYRANFSARELRICDVADLAAADLPGRADLAWASFPCQDLSEAGKGAGLEGYRSNAVWPCLRLVQALRAEGRPPRLIALENVSGLMEPRSADFFDAICGTLHEAGYRFGVVVIDAALFTPQSRERVFITAIDKTIMIPDALLADKPSLPFHPRPLVAALSRQPSQPLWWRLPVPPARNTILADLIEDPPTGVAWEAPAKTAGKIGMMSPVNLAKLEAAKRSGRPMIGGLFRRSRGKRAAGTHVSRWEIRFDDVAGCLRVPSGGSSRQQVMIVNGDKVRSRLLSPREGARLMGLDDAYRLPRNVNQGLALIGDGVCVNVVAHLARHVFEPLLPRPFLGESNRC
jgi:DNA (cytosine-5)-methyltransferase 1